MKNTGDAYVCLLRRTTPMVAMIEGLHPRLGPEGFRRKPIRWPRNLIDRIDPRLVVPVLTYFYVHTPRFQRLMTSREVAHRVAIFDDRSWFPHGAAIAGMLMLCLPTRVCGDALEFTTTVDLSVVGSTPRTPYEIGVHFVELATS
jgi:hypothetical protein